MQTLLPSSFPPLSTGRPARLLRAGSLAWQRAFWARHPLSVSSAERILKSIDPGGRVLRRLTSETHQVFQANFRGRPAVAKFGGVDFDCKFVLKGEVARLRGLCAAGAPVPDLLFAAEDRYRHPFFIAADLGAVPRPAWSTEVHERSWEFEASLIRDYPALLARAQLPVASVEAGRESLALSTDRIETELEEFSVVHPEFLRAVAEFREELDRYPWIEGCHQPPEVIFDGRRFWAIDWDASGFVPAMKWVCDYTFFAQLREPPSAWRHADVLAAAIGLGLTEAELRVALRRWYRFKALDLGLYFLRKDRRWEYFRLLQRAFFGGVLIDTPAASLAVFSRSFAG